MCTNAEVDTRDVFRTWQDATLFPSKGRKEFWNDHLDCSLKGLRVKGAQKEGPRVSPRVRLFSLDNL
jgi:hypothetical protein